MSSLHQLERTTDALKKSAAMPVLFLGHGSPMNAIEENEFVQGFRAVSQEIPTPQAILCISAHWETEGTRVTAMEKPKTIHDFGGFPIELYEVQYPAPGDPELANELVETLPGLVKPDFSWGLDHGAWSVIKHLYPLANIPVIQMSIDRYIAAEKHYDLAKRLRKLRNKGVLIIGSGNMVHNLYKVAWDKIETPGYAYDWAMHATDFIKSGIQNGDHLSLIHYDRAGAEMKLAVPTPEHYIPLIYALGLTDSHDEITFFNDQPVGGSLSMTSVKFIPTN